MNCCLKIICIFPTSHYFCRSKIFFPGLLSDNSRTMHRLMHIMRIYRDQDFDDEIDHKCYKKDLSRWGEVSRVYFKALREFVESHFLNFEVSPEFQLLNFRGSLGSYFYILWGHGSRRPSPTLTHAAIEYTNEKLPENSWKFTSAKISIFSSPRKKNPFLLKTDF